LPISRFPKKVLLIINPHAGSRWRQRQLPRIIEKLQHLYGDLAQERTAGRGDATRLARKALKEGYQLVLCAGGDGTLNEVINGLAGETLPLGIIPLGTGNGLAREIGLSTQPLKACDQLAHCVERSISLGKVGRRFFVLIAGAGIDSYTVEQVENHHQSLKKYTGLFSYFLIGLSSLFRYSFPILTFRVDGREFVGTSGTVAKGKLWVGPIPIAPATLGDPRLCLCLIRSQGPVHYLWIALSFLLSFGRIKEAEFIFGRDIEIDSLRPTSYHLDGEICGTLPVRIGTVPDALRLLFPKEPVDPPLRS